MLFQGDYLKSVVWLFLSLSETLRYITFTEESVIFFIVYYSSEHMAMNTAKSVFTYSMGKIAWSLPVTMLSP